MTVFLCVFKPAYPWWVVAIIVLDVFWRTPCVAVYSPVNAILSEYATKFRVSLSIRRLVTCASSEIYERSRHQEIRTALNNLA
jgi:hypothetical protein